MFCGAQRVFKPTRTGNTFAQIAPPLCASSCVLLSLKGLTALGPNHCASNMRRVTEPPPPSPTLRPLRPLEVHGVRISFAPSGAVEPLPPPYVCKHQARLASVSVVSVCATLGLCICAAGNRANFIASG